MKDGYTHVGLVLDASGSMDDIADDIRGSLRSFAKEQLALKEPDETISLDAWQFSNSVDHFVCNAPLETYDPSGYRCGGSTALYDAICVAIDELGRQFAAMPEEERPEDVVFVIATDGYENASRMFGPADVRERIDRQTKVYNWKFVFLASNIDVEEVGEELGIKDRVALEPACFVEEMACEMRAMQDRVRRERRERRNDRNRPK